ncbi:MAG: TlpA disulfide reductase family protein, partial [Dysgonamonadaceae bacterium]
MVNKKKKRKKKNTKKTLIEYGIIAAVGIILYATGLHTEVIGFAQRGLLATGLITPNVEKIAQERSDETEMTTTTVHTPADFNLTLMDKDGKTISLTDFKGKVIFMNMWATWCPPCIAEMPNINKL